MAKKQVLCVYFDEDADPSNHPTEQISDKDYCITVVSNAHDAQGYLLTGRIDYLLTDTRIPSTEKSMQADSLAACMMIDKKGFQYDFLGVGFFEPGDSFETCFESFGKSVCLVSGSCWTRSGQRDWAKMLAHLVEKVEMLRPTTN